MKRLIISIIVLLVNTSLVPAGLNADGFFTPPIDSVEINHYTCYNEDLQKNVSQMSASQLAIYLESAKEFNEKITPYVQGGEKFIRIQREVVNQGDKSLAIEFLFQDSGGKLKSKEVTAVMKNTEGKILRKEYYDFADPALNYSPFIYQLFLFCARESLYPYFFRKRTLQIFIAITPNKLNRPSTASIFCGFALIM